MTKCNGCPAIVVAAHNGHVEIVQLLLKSGVHPDISDREKCTALYMACLRGHTDVISELLSSGADVNTQTNEGATGLAIASQMGYRDIVVLLLDQKGVDASLAGNKQGTPLVRAVSHNHAEIVDMLINAGNGNVRPTFIILSLSLSVFLSTHISTHPPKYPR